MTPSAPASDATELTSPPAPSDGRRWRKRTAGVLVVLACLSVLISTLAVMCARTVFNTDVFVRRVTSVSEDPEFTAALGGYVTDQVMTLIDVPELVTNLLPNAGPALAGPIDTAIRGRVEDRVVEVLDSDAFKERFETLLARSHRAALSLLEGEQVAGFELQNDTVVLNTLPILADVLRRLGADGLVERAAQLPAFGGDEPPPEQIQQLGDTLGIEIPPDFGQIEVFSSDDLQSAQDALQLFRQLIVAILVATFLLVGLALVLSTRRWRTVAQLGIGVAAGMLIALAVFAWAQSNALELIAERETRDTARVIITNLLDTFRTVVRVLLVVGLLVALGGFLFGDSNNATRLRRRVASVGGTESSAAGGLAAFAAAHADGLRVLVIAAGALLLVWIGLDLVGVLVALVVAGGGYLAIELLSRRVAPSD